MDFKVILKSWLPAIGFIIIISCGKESSSVDGGEPQTEVVDSIVFETSNEERVYLGQRLYPTMKAEEANPLVTPQLLSINRVGDTLFAFLDSEKLYNQGNKLLPYLSDSLIRHYYPRYFDVTIDDDLPYMVYLKSLKDYAQFVRSKTGVFYLETASIRDTVLSVFGDVKVGLEKEVVFEALEFPDDLIDQQDFTLILCHGAVPTDMWFVRDGNRTEQIRAQKSPTQVLMRFKENRLELIFIDPWIGYAKMDYSSH